MKGPFCRLDAEKGHIFHTTFMAMARSKAEAVNAEEIRAGVFTEQKKKIPAATFLTAMRYRKDVQ